MRAAALALALAACSFPTKHFDNGSIDAPPGTADGPHVDAPFGLPDGPPDAPPGMPDATAGPFACRNQNPTTAPSTINLTGQEFDPTTGTSSPGINVELRSGGSVVANTTTDGMGKFAFNNLPTFGMPISNGSAHAFGGGFTDAWFYPPVPIAKDVNAPMYMMTTTEFSMFGNQPLIFLQVIDCNGAAMAGATVNASAGMVTYYQNGNFVTNPPTDASGFVVIQNVPAGTTETLTGIASDGGTLRMSQFTILPNTVNNTWMQP